MPEVGHFVIGLSILIPVIYLTDGKFNKKVAVIFLLSNWIGPDHGQIFSKLLSLEDLTGLDFHWFIPFLLWAIPLAYFYSYFSRFSVKKTERFYSISDDGKRDVNWKNSYLLCVSGGLLHTIADAFFRHNVYDSTIKFLDGFIEPKIGELNQLAFFGIDIGAFHVIMTYFVAIFVVFIAMYLLDRDFRGIIQFYSIYIALVFVITLFFVGSEYDTAVIILSVTFIVLPLMLLFYVDKDVRNKPTSIPEGPRIKAETGFKIVGSISTLISFLFLILGIIAIANPAVLNFEDVGVELIQTLGILILIVSIVMVISNIGMFLKIDTFRIVLVITYSFFMILVYPLILMLYLCQENVKDIFARNTEE